jgi:hypothetical protein
MITRATLDPETAPIVASCEVSVSDKRVAVVTVAADVDCGLLVTVVSVAFVTVLLLVEAADVVDSATVVSLDRDTTVVVAFVVAFDNVDACVDFGDGGGLAAVDVAIFVVVVSFFVRGPKNKASFRP